MAELGTGSPQVPADQTADQAGVADRIGEVLRALSAALRSHRLYSGQGPMLERFLGSLREKLLELWELLPLVRLEIHERSMTWEGTQVFPSGDSGTELAFLFFKDGIREIAMLPGFESEVGQLLDVLARAPQVREEEDDLITLLWQQDFGSFQYQYVEPSLDTGEEAGRAEKEHEAIDPAEVRTDAEQPPRGLTPEDFRETLYFLDDAELTRLAEEVTREARRDLWEGVTTALFDRLEDGEEERQARIVRILDELLPSLLGGADFARSARLLQELAEISGRSGVLSVAVLGSVRGIFGRLADPATITELVKVLESSPEALANPDLEVLFAYFPPEALAPLARAVSTTARPDVRRALERVVERLARANRDEVVRLLGDSDPTIVAGAARWIGAFQIGSAAGAVAELLHHSEPAVRVAALDALAQLRAAMAGRAIEALLEDPDREVRLAAARALAALEFTPARATLEEVLQSKRLRAADRTEKVAFFEAYGKLGGGDAVPFLDRTLNGRSWLGRGETTEIRACAALGLAKTNHPSARVALSAAANDSDPVVRTTVARALRGEEA